MRRYSHFTLAGILLQDETVGTVTLGGPLGTIIQYNLSEGDDYVSGLATVASNIIANLCRRVQRARRIGYKIETI